MKSIDQYLALITSELSASTDWDHYVYVLFDLNGVPRYVGKGKGRRWLHHEMPVFMSREKNATKKAFIERTIAGLGEVPKIKVREGLSSFEAKDLEVALICAIGRSSKGPLTNQTDGGDGGNRTFSAEHKEALSRAAKRRLEDPVYNQWWREQKLTNGAHSPESVAKMAATKRGKKQSPEHRLAISIGNKGRRVSTETRKKISESNKGRQYISRRGVSRPEVGVKISQLVWITDGKKRRRVKPDSIPLGWHKGWHLRWL